jgi:hypothetical protein
MVARGRHRVLPRVPSRGKYCFAIQQGTCHLAFALLGDTTDVYPFGAAWRFDNALRCDFCCPEVGGRFDMIFKIEFCDAAVPSESATWGRVKASYR